MESLKHHFLIAMPMLGDSNFTETVTYVCQHDAEGALGIVVNKPANITLGELCSRMEITVTTGPHCDRPVLAGGPVETARGFVLHRSTEDFESTLQIDGGIRLTTSLDILKAMAAGRGPDESLFALGYAGWGCGQLEREIAENAWLSVAATHELLFETPFDRRWAAAAQLIGVDIRGISSYSGHA